MYNDIFKLHIDRECKNLTRYNKRNRRCFYEKNDEKCIEKYFLDNDVFKHECYIYNTLKTYDILVKIIHLQPNKITYDTKNLISLFRYIQKYKGKLNLTLVFNELFCFVRNFKRYNFVHGNLNIHNIFVDKTTFKQTCKFYIMDLDNSYIEKKHEILDLYIDNKSNDKGICNFDDVYTLTDSLKLYIKEADKIL